MKKPIDIVFIGTGNVATHIADSVKDLSSVRIIQLFNHSKNKRSKDLAKKHNCSLTTDYKKINTTAHLYIIAVKDDVVEEVVSNLIPLKLKGIIAHTSGSIDINVLAKASNNNGVYYPLQSFYPKAKINWENTPILIEANNKKTLSTLKQLAASVSKNMKNLNSEERLKLHLAAVFACNFTNALYVSAFEIIESFLNKKDTKLLLPIMRDSFNKLESIHPKTAQTGPAKRNDKTVMQKHLQLLHNNSELSKVYKLLSELIIIQQK